MTLKQSFRSAWNPKGFLRRTSSRAIPIRRGRPGTALLWIALILSGCSATIPVGKYDTLKSSTELLASNTADTFLRIERLQRRFTVVTAPDSPLTMNTFRPAFGGMSFDIVPELNFRESALNVIVRYTRALYTLSSKDYVSDVDKASQEFAAGVKDFAENAGAQRSGEAAVASGALATLVDVMGRQVVNQGREEGLRMAMDTAQQSITELCNLIAGSNTRISQAVDLMAGRILAHANTIRPPFATAGRYEFDAGMAEFADEIASIHGSLDVMSRAVKHIPRAHKEIREALAKHQSTFESLHSLIQEVQRASKFYRSLTD